jgi:hypothetical protein
MSNSTMNIPSTDPKDFTHFSSLFKHIKNKDTVTGLLIAEIAEPDKTPTAKQWFGKHISAAAKADATAKELLEKKHTIIEELLEAVITMQSTLRPKRSCSEWLAVNTASESASNLQLVSSETEEFRVGSKH